MYDDYGDFYDRRSDTDDSSRGDSITNNSTDDSSADDSSEELPGVAIDPTAVSPARTPGMPKSWLAPQLNIVEPPPKVRLTRREKRQKTDAPAEPAAPRVPPVRFQLAAIVNHVARSSEERVEAVTQLLELYSPTVGANLNELTRDLLCDEDEDDESDDTISSLVDLNAVVLPGVTQIRVVHACVADRDCFALKRKWKRRCTKADLSDKVTARQPVGMTVEELMTGLLNCSFSCPHHRFIEQIGRSAEEPDLFVLSCGS